MKKFEGKPRKGKARVASHAIMKRIVKEWKPVYIKRDKPKDRLK